MKEVVKNVEVAAIVCADTHEVWQYVVRAIADAAAETDGKAKWFARVGDGRAHAAEGAASILRLMAADMSNAAGLQTSESK